MNSIILEIPANLASKLPTDFPRVVIIYGSVISAEELEVIHIMVFEESEIDINDAQMHARIIPVMNALME